MKALLAILKREFLAYFFSPLAYVVLTAFLFINGYVFYAILLSLNSPETSRQELMALFFKNVFYWIFMMLVSSIVAMRLISEERKSGSIEALLTAPVGEGTVRHAGGGPARRRPRLRPGARRRRRAPAGPPGRRTLRGSGDGRTPPAPAPGGRVAIAPPSRIDYRRSACSARAGFSTARKRLTVPALPELPTYP